MTENRQRVAIIGAGPIGLEAALKAINAGFEVAVYERGRVAENLLRWGHVRLFSPLGLNASPWGRQALAECDKSAELPDETAILTGREFADTYLLPLSRLPLLCERIHEGVAVVSIGRTRTWKGDLIGKPGRQDDPFQLLLREDDGERTATADYLLDCSGTFPRHNCIGAGGMPCVGEREYLEQIDYELPDILGKDRARFAGCRTLVVGSGYSAATAIVSLGSLAETAPETRAIWITRSDNELPMARIPDDQLTERDRLATNANQLASTKDGPIKWLPARLIRRIDRSRASGEFTVTIESAESATGQGGETGQVIVDRVIANVGYRPDARLYEELQVHQCYATEGPMKLAAALLGETSADCLTQSGHGADTLRNPEPGFFILGSKSYGRNSRFLLKIGFEQIQDVFSMIEFSRRTCPAAK